MATGDGLATFLALLAVDYVPEPVRVTWRGSGFEHAGRVHWGGDAWAVELADGLPVESLTFTFFHELAHIVNGDVAKSRAAAVPLERAKMVFPGIAARVAADKERRASDWAAERVAELGESVRWLLDVLSR